MAGVCEVRLASDRGFHTPGPPWDISRRESRFVLEGRVNVNGVFMRIVAR